MFSDSDVISTYTRAQAIEDGVLVDVSDTASEAGFGAPVAVTRRVWDEVVTPDPRARTLGQSISGRLCDMLRLLRGAAAANGGADHLLFRVLVVMKARQRWLVTLKALFGPGDDGEPWSRSRCPTRTEAQRRAESVSVTHAASDTVLPALSIAEGSA